MTNLSHNPKDISDLVNKLERWHPFLLNETTKALFPDIRGSYYLVEQVTQTGDPIASEKRFADVDIAGMGYIPLSDQELRSTRRINEKICRYFEEPGPKFSIELSIGHNVGSIIAYQIDTKGVWDRTSADRVYQLVFFCTQVIAFYRMINRKKNFKKFLDYGNRLQTVLARL